MSKAYDVLMVEVGNMSKRQTTAVFDYVDELRAGQCKHHIAMTMQHPCQACGREWQAHSQSDAGDEQITAPGTSP